MTVADLDHGKAAKDEGQARALAAKAAWTDAAWHVLIVLAAGGEPFTSEALIAVAGLPSGAVGANANNAVGAIMNAAARQGLIVKTGRRVLAERRESHAAELTEWRGNTN